MKNHIKLILSILFLTLTHASFAEASPMNNKKLHELITRIDAKPTGQLGYWEIKYQNIPVYIITSEEANRMRIISPIEESANLKK